MRPRGERDAQHFLGRRHFEIERLGDFGLEARDIVVGDMAPVLAQVRGDPSAPAAIAALAARTGSGNRPPRAFLTVAT
jgi:hypothetical protein